MLNLLQLKNKRIVVLGLGLTGMSFVRFLTDNAFKFVVNDSRTANQQFDVFKSQYPDIKLITGCWDSKIIENAEILLVSPGVDITKPEIADYISSQCQVWGDIELYARLVNTPCVAVTGSNGKSTVVNLLHHIGQKLGINTQLGGNVGVPILDTINAKVELLVLELSSFQLETLSSLTPQVACILNVSDDHLDRHKTMKTYTSLKQRIYLNAKTTVYNRDDSATKPEVNTNETSFGKTVPVNGNWGLVQSQDGLSLAFGEQILMPVSQLPISGIHNATNVLAAFAIGYLLGWNLEKMVAAVPSFSGLAHRCQLVSKQNNITWINDSKATNVGATVAAIEGISPTLSANQKIILIAGGDSKGADLSLLKTVINQHVSKLYALGKDKDKLLALAENSQAVESMEEAVSLANQAANNADVVLLSPACASIDMFANFAERGDAFVNAISHLREAS